MASTTATIKHRFQTAKANRTDVDVSATRWNDSEVMAGGSTGGLVVRDSAQTDGWGLVDAVAMGQVLISAGTSTLPAWSASPAVTSLAATSYVSIGTNPATTGAVRLANGGGVYIRNSINTTDICAIGSDGSDNLVIASNTNSARVVSHLYPYNDDVFTLGSASLRWKTAYLSTSVSIGTNPATTGAIRLANNQEIGARNAANTSDLTLLKLDSSNNTVVGSSVAVNMHLLNNGTLYLYGDGITAWQIYTKSLIANVDNTYDIGMSGLYRPRNGYFGTSIQAPLHYLTDGVTAPATVAGYAILYVDTADGDLKVKFGDGVVKTIVVDT